MNSLKYSILINGKKLGLFFRGLTSSFRVYPDFVIPGVQKGGTTSLYAYLDQHPELKLSRPKEVHFFDDQYHKGMSYYRRFFPLKFNGKKTGESSPYYIFHPHVAQRIKRHLPNCKIIIVLRNPIMRAYSHFYMQKRQGYEKHETFEAAIDAEEQRLKGEMDKMVNNEHYYSEALRHFSYAARGKYADQVKKWLDVFGADKILFIKSENLLENPGMELKRVYKFLDIKEVLPSNMSKKHVNTYPDISIETMDKLKNVFLEDQQKLIGLIGKDFTWF